MAMVYHQLMQSRSIDVLTIAAPRSWLSQKQNEIQPLLTTKIPPAWPILPRREIAKAVKDFDAEAIIAHGTRAITIADGIEKIKHIGVIHNTRFKKSFSNLDLMIAVSSGVQKKAKREFPNNKVIVVPNHVTISPNKFVKSAGKPLVFGTMGRLHHNKGFDVFLNALTDPKLQIYEWQAVIAGTGPENNRLRQMVKDFKLNDRVKFLGWIDDLDSFYNSIDVFVLPSREEPFGLVLLEAMARQCPVIATDTDGPLDIIKNNSTGILVERDNIQQLAKTLIDVINNNFDLHAMTDAAFQNLNQKYNFDKIADDLSAALKTIMS